MPISQLSLDDNPSDPELAKYLNRDYWESRKITESPASPSAPSPMAQPHDAIPLKVSKECFYKGHRRIFLCFFLFIFTLP